MKHRTVPFARLYAVAAVAMVALAPQAKAAKVVISCTLIRDYSDFQVSMMIGQARAAVGAQETQKLYAKYLSLKTECQTNAAASRVVALSPALDAFLARNGVDTRRMRLSER